MDFSDFLLLFTLIFLVCLLSIGVTSVSSEPNADQVWCENNGGRWIEFNRDKCVFLPDNK